MPDFSLKADFSLFDFIKKKFFFEDLKSFKTSKNGVFREGSHNQVSVCQSVGSSMYCRTHDDHDV